MQVTDGWVGANTEEQARQLIESKFPGCTIHKLYQKLSGMWAFEITEQGSDQDGSFEESTDEVLEQEPPEEEPEGLESDVL